MTQPIRHRIGDTGEVAVPVGLADAVGERTVLVQREVSANLATDGDRELGAKGLGDAAVSEADDGQRIRVGIGHIEGDQIDRRRDVFLEGNRVINSNG